MKIDNKIRNYNDFPKIGDCDGFIVNDLIHLFLEDDVGVVVLYPNDAPLLINHCFGNWNDVIEEFGPIVPIEKFKITVERA